MAVREVVENRRKVRREENFFLTVFSQVVERINKERASDDDISSSINTFVDFFRENHNAHGLCAAGNFRTLEDYLGYFYWNSPISAAVTRHKTIAALENCSEFRSLFNQESHIWIVSVGGGTGSDLVGLYSALYEYSHFNTMTIYVIEKNRNWQLFFDRIHRVLNSDDFGDASRFMTSGTVGVSFMCSAMPVNSADNMTTECTRALGKASLVWMKGFLSVLHNDSERRNVTKKIISSMSPGALLVLMETPAYDQVDEFDEENKLRRIFNTTDGDYELCDLLSIPDYHISTKCRQEISIFERV